MVLVSDSESFVGQVVAETPRGERLRHCIQCGTCGGSCPNGAEMDYSPRALFALIQMGERETVLQANTMWQCVSCYFCTSRCPQEIPITDVMYTLKRMSIREGFARNTDAPALASTFAKYVDRYGRSFEMGLASTYLLVHKPVTAVKTAGLGMSMVKRGRMPLRPTKIREIGQLKAVLGRARELGGVS